MDLRSPARRAARATRLGTVLPLDATLHLYGGTDKWQHAYGPHYAEHFRPARFRARRVLEIGVGGYLGRKPGGSLRVWRDYFIRAKIVGIDIEPKDIDLGRRVSFVQGDQTDPATLDAAVASLGGPPDIVIDDGSHYVDHAEMSFTHLFPQMPSGAWYVIEDLHSSYWPDFGGDVPAPVGANTRFIERLVDSVQLADPTFSLKPDRQRPAGRGDVSAVDVRPGVAFIRRR